MLYQSTISCFGPRQQLIPSMLALFIFTFLFCHFDYLLLYLYNIYAALSRGFHIDCFGSYSFFFVHQFIYDLKFIFFLSFWFKLQVGELKVVNKVHKAELKLFLEVEHGPVTFILWSCILYFDTTKHHSSKILYMIDKLHYYIGFVSHWASP
jgi:hypothetical protein